MRAVYIGRHFSDDNNRMTIGCISMPILERKKIKKDLKEITKEVFSFNDISYDNIKIFYMCCKLFIKESNLTATIYHVTKPHRSEYCKIIFNTILNEYIKHDCDSLRVYIPFDSNKNILRNLNTMANTRNLPISFEEARFNESSFQQLASLLSGCIYYRKDDENYLECLGKTPEAQLTAYIYAAKKEKGKLDIFDYIRKKKK